jgi:acyl-CoA synthetase (NDP forming)
MNALLNPTSMAIVGASDRSPSLSRLVEQNVGSGVRMYFVNPRYKEVLGQVCYPALEEIGESVDTVLCTVNASLVPDVIESAASLGIRSAVITAANLGEGDQTGKQRQDRVARAAGASMAICGPNCVGVLNVAKAISVCGRPATGIRRGGLALVSQSGGLVTALIDAGAERLLGFSYLISSGNEAVTDLTDYVDYLIADPETTAIGMVVETIRRPAPFVEAAYRARAAGKPLVVLKLGRSEIGKRMSTSHTGAIMGDAQDYDAMFQQTGVIVAQDIDDFLDLTQILSNPKHWGSTENIGVLCSSGGSAALVSDAFDAAEIPLKIDPPLAEWMRQRLPTNALGNPVDITGIFYNPGDFGSVFDQFLQADTYDTVLIVSSSLGASQEAFNHPVVSNLERVAGTTSKRLILASTMASGLGPWAGRLHDLDVMVTRGIGPTIRSLKAVDHMLAVRDRPRPSVNRTMTATMLAGGFEEPSRLLPFEDCSRVLSEFGIPVAPFVIIDDASRSVVCQLADVLDVPQYVLKVADMVHRSDFGAVRRGVTQAAVPSVTDELLQVAVSHGAPPRVVVQPDLQVDAELFLGMSTGGGLGPIMVFGSGGVFVEDLADVTARLAPIGEADAWEMLKAVRVGAMLRSSRRSKPVDMQELAGILVAFGQLAAATAASAESIEINPLVLSDGHFYAVDLRWIRRDPD